MRLTECTLLRITLAAKALTDKFTLQTRQPIALNQIITGQIKDFSFTFKAQKCSVSTGTVTVDGIYDIEQLLNKPVAYTVTEVTAVNTAQAVAAALGREVNISIVDYHTHNMSSNKPTCKTLFSNLFGWTDKVPHRQINVFLRGGVIHVLQRGKESGIVTIQNYGEGYTVSKEQLTTLEDPTDTLGNAVRGIAVGKAGKEDDGGWYEDSVLKTGTETVGDVTRSWTNGLLMSETNLLSDGTTETTTWTYTALRPPCYVAAKTTETAKQRILAEYYRFADGSARVEEFVYTWGIQPDGSDGLIFDYKKTTRYNAVGQGNYSVRTEIDGEIVSSEISSGSPFQQATAYEVKVYSIDATSDTVSTTYSPPWAELPARLKVDMEGIPITKQAELETIAEAIIWLNGKTEERVSLEVYDESILDFTKRIIWQGNEYYLDSNTIIQEPEKFVQRVELVRWYE